MAPATLVGPAQFTRALLRRQEKATVALPLERVRVSSASPRMRFIADCVKKDALAWLVRSGGWRSRQVVVGGRRHVARVWDAKVFARLGVRFTAGPLRLLVAAMETSESYPLLPAKVQAVIQGGVLGDDPATGDLLALHRIVSSLERSSLSSRGAARQAPQGARCPACGAPLTLPRGAKSPPERCAKCSSALSPADFEAWGDEPSDQAQQLATLSLLSPLTLAFEPERAGVGAGGRSDEAATLRVAARFAPLFRGDRAVLLSYLDDALAQSWLAAESRRRSLSPQDSRESYAAMTLGLRGYLRAAEDRPDAMRPLMSFFHAYVSRRFGGRAPVLEDLTRQSQGFNRASEREAFLHTAGELFALGAVVRRAAEDALSAPYVDRTEAQKVLIADYHERFREVAPEVEAIRRELVGEIG